MTIKMVGTRRRKTSISWVITILGVIVLAIGCYLIFGHKLGSPVGTYELEAASARELQGYHQRGDHVECNFTILGGNEQVNFTIRNPSGVVVNSSAAKSPYPYFYNFTALHSGSYSYIFGNPENVTKSIQADFRSPLQPPHYILGVLVLFGSIITLFFGMCGIWSYYRYGSKQLVRVKLDPARFPKGFWEFLFSNKYIGIGNDYVDVPLLGKFRYWMWCVLFGILLYILGGISAVLSDTVVPDSTREIEKGFGGDFYFLTLSIVTGLTSLFVLRALRGLGDKLVYTNRHLTCSLDSKVRHTRDRTERTISGELDLKNLEKDAIDHSWLKKNNMKFWYWVSFSGFGLIGLFVGWWTATHNPTVWIGIPWSFPWCFCIVGCGVVGATVGALIFVSAKGITILSFYCKTCFLPHNTSDPEREPDRISIGYDPDRLSGLKRIGEFSFELDFAAATPSFAFLASYISGTELRSLTSLICLSAYTLILFTILFLPLHPFHIKMASAKESALADINRKFYDAYFEIQKSDGRDWTRVRKLEDIYLLQERISKKPLWPFPRWDPKLFATLFLPVLLSVVSNYISMILGFT